MNLYRQGMAGRSTIRTMVLMLLAVVSFAPRLWAADDFLPPEKAYRYTAHVEGDKIVIQWQIEKGYYLYKKKLGVSLGKDAAGASSTAVQLDEPLWPKGENHHDEYFGDQEIYRNAFEVPVAFTTTGISPATVLLELKLQGCADAGICYPPLRWKTEVALPAKTAATGSSNNLQSMFGRKNAPDSEFLPPDDAFKFGAGIERADSIALTWIIAKGYYLYKDKVTVTTDSSDIQIGKPTLPKGELKHDEFFGDTEVYHDMLEASMPLARAAGSAGKINLKVTYQGCAEGGLCYNPITKNIALDLPPAAATTTLPTQPTKSGALSPTAPVAEQDKLATLIRDGNLLAVLGTFFGLGLLLAFTPCVLPMIPILSGIIVGQGDKVTPLRGFSLAFTYVQGMALTYAAAGAAFVLAFKQAPQAFFQQPWIIGLMVTLFVVLAIAMFGAFTLQMPSAIQSRLTDVSNQQKSGTYVGTFIMGALSALVVTACVAPAIIAALSVISQTGQIARGAGALYATGLGMGVPLLAVGASAGSLLPRVGPWMDTVKQLFGALFLGVAIYLLEPLLPDTVMLLLWSALTVITGFWIFSLKARDGGPAPAAVRGAGLLVLIYGVILLIGLASGGHDPLQPLDGLRSKSGTTGRSADTSVLTFQRIKSLADMDRAVAAASAAGKPVMLDFYADWCTSCKEMEKYTFTDAAVRSALADVVLLQADVTANDEQDQALLARFEIYGPPTIAFFGADGVESKNHRVVGYMKAEKFAPHVRSAIAGG